ERTFNVAPASADIPKALNGSSDLVNSVFGAAGAHTPIIYTKSRDASGGAPTHAITLLTATVLLPKARFRQKVAADSAVHACPFPGAAPIRPTWRATD